ncbi:RNA-binding protein 45 [Biomphalaria glabrata]
MTAQEQSTSDQGNSCRQKAIIFILQCPAQRQKGLLFCSNGKDLTTDHSPPSVSTRSHSKDNTSGATAVRSNSQLASNDNIASAPAVHRCSRSNNGDSVDTFMTLRASSKTDQKEGGLVNVGTSAKRTSSRESVQHNFNVSGVEGLSRQKLTAEREKGSRSRVQSRSQYTSSRTNSDKHLESSGSRKSSDKVSVEITFRSSGIPESGRDTFTNTKTFSDTKPGEDRSQTRTKFTKEQWIHIVKLWRIDSRVPIERQMNMQVIDKRELNEVNEQKECKSDATVSFTEKSKPAD